MRVIIDQYSNEILMTGKTPVFAMDIRYSGTFVGELNIPAQVVSMNNNRILLSRIDGLEFEGLILTYEGKLSIKGIHIYTGRFNKVPCKIIKHSDDFNKTAETWNTLGDKYEDLDKTNKNESYRKTLLSYKKGEKDVYLHKGLRHKNVGKLPQRELKILQTIKEKNNGIK
tara:strand:- start:2147 stop:2656 length:510 start_codon:yes stop_codon:yes gene_type:complete